jgi:hypothetical protein
MSKPVFRSSRGGSWVASGYLVTLLCLIGTFSPALADSTILSTEPLLSQNPSERTLVTKPLQAMQTAGVSLSFKHVSEILSREGPEAKVPLMGGLSDFGIRWSPHWFGPLRRGIFAATYTFYSQSRDSVEADLQGLSSNATDSFRRWREAYFELPISERIRLKLGKVDANTEFAVIENGADFSNASFGVSPTLFTMPSYPNGAASANAFMSLTTWLTAGAGVYRVAGGAIYSVAEAGGRWGGKRSGRVAIGHWNQSAARNGLEDSPPTAGVYTVWEQTIVARDREQGMRVFARFSTAPKSIAPASTHAAYGVTWTGFGPREQDSIGLALLALEPSSGQVPLRLERAFEAYYKLTLSKHFAIKMDLQHIQRPGGLPAAGPMTVASVRFVVNSSTPTQE